jgi:DNA-binding transcriptional MerR regulator
MGQPATVIPEKIYFKIGEVCDLVGVQAHVLRYWETEFPQLSPQKNRSGQRSYRRKDVEISLRIKELLYDEMFTIAGARKKLQAELKPDGPKLKIVRPGSQPDNGEKPAESATPSLFDEDLTLDDAPTQEAAAASPTPPSRGLAPDQIDALRTLASHLLELREMLKTDQTAEASRHLQNRGI